MSSQPEDEKQSAFGQDGCVDLTKEEYTKALENKNGKAKVVKPTRLYSVLVWLDDRFSTASLWKFFITVVPLLLILLMFSLPFIALIYSWLATQSALGDLEMAMPVAVSHAHFEQTLMEFTRFDHLAGSPGDLRLATLTADKFRGYGFSVETFEYFPLLSYPLHRSVQVELPDKTFFLGVEEESYTEDPDSNRSQVPPFHGYGCSGNVTGPVVYVNYGRPEDFSRLRAHGVEFNGTIALARYGRIFRGLIVRAAEQHGCLGVLIYSDPSDDGFMHGAV